VHRQNESWTSSVAVGVPVSLVPCQTTQSVGGRVHRYPQSWDVSNVFVIDASNFPQNASCNPTDTVGLAAYWAADALVNRYL
jgi:gluconate 2-dehydrogenase alpha chain